MDALNILILEDEPIIAMDLKDFCIELGHNVVAVCYNYTQALQQAELRNPNFALVDIRIGDKDDGITFGKKLTEEFGIPFIYITSFFDDNTLSQAKSTFPSGYLVKPISRGGLTAAIQVGASNFSKWQPNTQSLTEKMKKISNATLTNREVETIQHLMQGKTNHEIAESQFVTINTVKTHLKNIYLKFDVESRGQLIVLLNK
ncbi:MAG: DNA-binding response regulator [Chitinophagaceae bacterium]|nr:DNA-binding response regulator [Chitinophagaceae bacterium]